MSYDLTATTDGTIRTLGSKTYSYNSAKATWDLVPVRILDADITLEYDGYTGDSTGNEYNSIQYVKCTIIFNQPVYSFNISNITFNFGSPVTVVNNQVVQDTINTNKYTFIFQFSGAVFQFVIPANSITSSLTGSTNALAIYSPAIAGIYTPYPIVILQPRTGNLYNIADPFIEPAGSVTRYFTTALGTSSTTGGIRIRTTFQNFSSSVSTSSYTVADLDRTYYTSAPAVSTATFTFSGVYTTLTGTTTALATSNPRYSEIYATSSFTNTNSIAKISIASKAYVDGASDSGASVPVYFANLPSSVVVTSASTTKSPAAQATGLKVTFDHFLALATPYGQLPAINSIIRSSTATGNIKGTLSNLVLDTTTSPAGNVLSLSYTPIDKAIQEDYDETFTIPAGWVTFSGTNNVVKDPTSAASAFTTRQSSLTSTTISVRRSAPVLTAPSNGTTGVTATSLQINFNRPVKSIVNKSYRIYRFDNGSYTQVKTSTVPDILTLSSSATIVYDYMVPLTTYRIEIDAGAYQDDWGNLSNIFSFSFTTGTATAADAVYTITSTFVVPHLVSSIAAVAVGIGEDGYSEFIISSSTPGYAYQGGRGGGLSYKNNIPVTPGEILNVTFNPEFSKLSRGTTALLLAYSGASTNGTNAGKGGTAVDSTYGGGNGGAGGNIVTLVKTADGYGGAGGGGAGGYSGAGGAGAVQTTSTSAAGSSGAGGGGGGGSSRGSLLGSGGGGVGIYGQGANGSSNLGGSNGTQGGPGLPGGVYGGGGGGAAATAGYNTTGVDPTYDKGTAGGAGAIRIVWGANRAFPSTNVSTSTS